MKNIELSSYEHTQEREQRLRDTLIYVLALADQAENELVFSKVSQLHDHKGILTVTWHSAPTTSEKEFFSKAWASSVGDGADNVEHELSS